MRPPPRSTLFPYTTLFRSRSEQPVAHAVRFTDRLGGDLHGAVQLALLAADDPEVVPRLDYAAVELRLVIGGDSARSEEHTSELQSLRHLVCRLLLEKKKNE